MEAAGASKKAIEKEWLPERARIRTFETCAHMVPKRTSFRSRHGAPPEVWFRILHIAPASNNIFTEANLIEQKVEIALGSKVASENESVGTFKRRVTADRVVNVAAKARRSAKPPRVPRTPRVVELLRKAME